MSDCKTIMAIGAHHDDNEAVAGTLAIHKAAGWRVVSVVVTDGVWIRGEVSKEHIPIREDESLAAAELLGMESVFLRFPEGNFRSCSQSISAVAEQLRIFSPSVVITHPPRDYHSDHMQTSECVHEAVLVCANPCLRTQSAPCAQPSLYYHDAWFTPFEPDLYVDISDQIELKCEMRGCHKSQLPLPDGDGENGVDLLRMQSRVRGVEACVRYAEAFQFQQLSGSVRMEKILR